MTQAAGEKTGYRLCRHRVDVVPVNTMIYASREDPRLQRDLDLAKIGTDRSMFPDRWPFGLVPTGEVKRTGPVAAMMMRHADARIEGYWRDDEDREKCLPDLAHLPWPEAQSAPWKGKGEFLSALDLVERSARGVGRMLYMGSSACRVCGRGNGTGEFHDARPGAAHGWRWPDGLRHYVEEHNVEPSVAFQCFIVWRSRNPHAA